MRLAVPKESRAGETRVAATPESVKKFKGLGLDVVIQSGAGAGARIADADYQAAGAVIAPDATTTPAGRDIIWRSRAKKTPGLLAKIVKDSGIPENEKDRFMRAFDFQSGPEKDKALESLLQ